MPRWATILKRRGTVLFEVLVVKGQSNRYYKQMFGFDFELRNRKYLAGNIMLDLNETGRLRRLLETRIKENPQYLDWLSNKHYDQCKKILDGSRQISELKGVASLESSQLLSWFRQYVENVLRIMPSLMAMPTIERFLEERISEVVREKLSRIGVEELLETYMKDLVIPAKENFVARELRDIFSIGAQIQTDPELSNVFEGKPKDVIRKLNKHPSLLSRLREHSRNFGFLSMYTYEGEPLTLEDVVTRIKEAVEQDCLMKTKKIQRERIESENRFTEIAQKLEFSAATMKLIETAREYLYLRLYRLDVLNVAGFQVRKLLEEIARRMNLTYEEIIYLTHEEIINSLEEGNISGRALIYERKKDYGTVLINGELRVISGDELERVMASEKEIKETHETVSLLEGTVASLGKHKGKAKLVLYNPDVDKVKRGDVIVSTMTNPYYVHAMMRAGAIVTDEGGILSHAAIVSRELGIPCVTGTHVATKVLKDNDLVEVDATGPKGLVRILTANKRD